MASSVNPSDRLQQLIADTTAKLEQAQRATPKWALRCYDLDHPSGHDYWVELWRNGHFICKLEFTEEEDWDFQELQRDLPTACRLDPELLEQRLTWLRRLQELVLTKDRFVGAHLALETTQDRDEYNQAAYDLTSHEIVLTLLALEGDGL